jgi:hypothetical protein
MQQLLTLEKKNKHRFEILIIFEIFRLNFKTIGHYDLFTGESDFTLELHILTERNFLLYTENELA